MREWKATSDLHCNNHGDLYYSKVDHRVADAAAVLENYLETLVNVSSSHKAPDQAQRARKKVIDVALK